MKKFIIKISVFLLMLILSDLALGFAFNLLDYTKSGAIQKVHSMMTEATPELLILGSSRASHHYITSIIEDSLGLKAYNAGVDGQGTTISYALLKGVSQRKIPRLIICEITPNFDLFDTTGLGLHYLYPYIDNLDIRKMILDFNENDRIKLWSNAYRLNSKLFRIFPSMLSSTDYNKGYVPIKNQTVKDNTKDNTKVTPKIVYQVSKKKEKYLRKLICEALDNNCKIIFFISPVYKGGDAAMYQKEIDIIREYKIPIYNHMDDTMFITNPNLFSDRTHLNDYGACEYTKVIIEEIENEVVNK